MQSIKTITSQFTSKCIHFTGVMNTCCKAGIKYVDVRVGPMMFPCIKTGGECSNAQFPNKEEAEVKENEMMKDIAAGLGMFALVKQHIEKTRQQSGIIDCNCGGKVSFAVAGSNGHIRAKCSSCGISFME